MKDNHSERLHQDNLSDTLQTTTSHTKRRLVVALDTATDMLVCSLIAINLEHTHALATDNSNFSGNIAKHAVENTTYRVGSHSVSLLASQDHLCRRLANTQLTSCFFEAF